MPEVHIAASWQATCIIHMHIIVQLTCTMPQTRHWGVFSPPRAPFFTMQLGCTDLHPRVYELYRVHGVCTRSFSFEVCLHHTCSTCTSILVLFTIHKHTMWSSKASSFSQDQTHCWQRIACNGSVAVEVTWPQECAVSAHFVSKCFQCQLELYRTHTLCAASSTWKRSALRMYIQMYM